MSVVLANNASSRLAASVAAATTTISVMPGDGAKFPALTAGDWFPLTIVKSDGALEIVKCTARSTDTFTVTRAQEGTAALAFSAGDRVELRLTAAAVNEVNQTAINALAGNIQTATNAETQAGTVDNKAVTPASLSARTATESRTGLVELATTTEVTTGTDTSRAVTPAGLKAALDAKVVAATASAAGVVQLATNTEAQAGSNASKAVTPAALAARTATESRTGLVELATNAEVAAGTDTARAVTPAGLRSAYELPLGQGQNWANVTGSRAFYTDYVNTTGRSIAISVIASGGNSLKIYGVDGLIAESFPNNSGANACVFSIIPAGAVYNVTRDGGGSPSVWREMRV